jgi:hypothetical protein
VVFVVVQVRHWIEVQTKTESMLVADPKLQLPLTLYRTGPLVLANVIGVINQDGTQEGQDHVPMALPAAFAPDSQSSWQNAPVIGVPLPINNASGCAIATPPVAVAVAATVAPMSVTNPVAKD